MDNGIKQRKQLHQKVKAKINAQMAKSDKDQNMITVKETTM